MTGGEVMVDHREQMKKINERATPEIRKARAKKGAETRRKNTEKRKAMKETLEMLLSLPINDPETIDAMKDAGISTDEMNNQMMILVATMKQAEKGNMRAVEYIAQMIGENGEQKLNVSGNVPIVISGGDKLED